MASSSIVPKPVLVFGYGNISRGDDALGPLLLEYVEASCDHSAIDILADFQLQIEHALDLEGRALVLFVDATVSGQKAFAFVKLEPVQDSSYTTHAMSPSAVLQVYRAVKKQMPPPCFLLSIKAERFELGEGLSVQAQDHLKQACQFVERLLRKPCIEFWTQMVNEL